MKSSQDTSYQWRHATNMADKYGNTELAADMSYLPNTNKSVPVIPAKDSIMVPRGHIRFGLFPNDGGTTYLLNTGTGIIRPEGLINESYPETYWCQKSTELNRKIIKEALEQAQIACPAVK